MVYSMKGILYCMCMCVGEKREGVLGGLYVWGMCCACWAISCILIAFSNLSWLVDQLMYLFAYCCITGHSFLYLCISSDEVLQTNSSVSPACSMPDQYVIIQRALRLCIYCKIKTVKTLTDRSVSWLIEHTHTHHEKNKFSEISCRMYTVKKRGDLQRYFMDLILLCITIFIKYSAQSLMSRECQTVSQHSRNMRRES